MPDNTVIDLSHYNTPVDFNAIATAGIQGVIHKATQGVTGTDATYSQRKPLALAAGLLWGAYHFGTEADGVAQADHLLATIGWQAGDGTLLALDFEGDGTTTMTQAQAEAFVQQIKDRTGRWPLIYGGTLLRNIAKGSSVLGDCKLWLSEYGPTARVPAAWDHWSLWQYTDGIHGPEPHSVRGAGSSETSPCDRDQFNREVEGDLATFWSA